MAEKQHRTIRLMLSNIQFLPAKKIPKGARCVLDLQRRYGLNRIFAKLNKYYERYWIRNVKPEGFTMYKVDHRTDNINEATHSKMGRSLCRHPTYYNFLGFMKKMMITENQKIVTNREYTQNSRMTANLQEAWAALDNRVISVGEFLRKNFNESRNN